MPDATCRKEIVRVSFCPELGIYRIEHLGQGEHFFDSWQLVKAVSDCRSEGKDRDADYLMQLTAWARSRPHAVVIFYNDKSYEFQSPKVIELRG
jgi:hypothetical protein